MWIDDLIFEIVIVRACLSHARGLWFVKLYSLAGAVPPLWAFGNCLVAALVSLPNPDPAMGSCCVTISKFSPMYQRPKLTMAQLG